MTSSQHRIATLTLIALVAGAAPGAAQVMIRRGGSGAEADAGSALVVRELGILVGPGEDGDASVHVIGLLPGVERDVEIAEGDRVFMLDGERVRDVATLRSAYEAATIGTELKLGIRRGNERYLASFAKKDPEEAGPGGMRVMIAGGPGADFDDILPLHELGAIVAESDGAIEIAAQLPGSDGLREGDAIKSFNGTAVETLADLRAAYEALTVGDSLSLVVARDGADRTLTGTKQDAPQMVRRVRTAP